MDIDITIPNMLCCFNPLNNEEGPRTSTSSKASKRTDGFSPLNNEEGPRTVVDNEPLELVAVLFQSSE